MGESRLTLTGNFTPDPSHYKVLVNLGTGWDGAVTVSLVKHEPSNQHVAVKRTNLEMCEDNMDEVQVKPYSTAGYIDVVHEVLLTRQLNHSNIVPYLATFVNNKEIWSIMPHTGYGSAKDLLTNHFALGFPELVVAFFLRDILQALQYIHSKGYVHRSVRASHILVDSSGQAYLTGLRYSCSMVENGRWQRAIHHFPSNTVRNLNWLSPEVLQQNLQGYNTSSDIYSLGITACEMANGIVPFADMVPSQMLMEKLQGATPCLIDSTTCFEEVENGDARQVVLRESNGIKLEPTPTLPGTQARVFSHSFHQFVQLCLHYEPTMRPAPSQLQSHSFIKQCRKATCSVTDMLRPAVPITVPSESKPEETVESAGNQLENLTMQDEVWIF